MGNAGCGLCALYGQGVLICPLKVGTVVTAQTSVSNDLSRRVDGVDAGLFHSVIGLGARVFDLVF
jgi:hypothetical protein